MVRSLRRQRIKNNIAESEQFRRRSFFGFICIALAMFVLALGYFRLQVLQHQEYQLKIHRLFQCPKCKWNNRSTRNTHNHNG